MDGFGLLVGHLWGDYVVQNDWMARCKTLSPFGKDSHEGDLACTVHCLLYTLSVWAFSFWWMPWWGLLACFVVHWPIDRFRLAYRCMTWSLHGGQQKDFAEKMGPWSVIVVDNTLHLATLFLIALCAGRVV